MVLQEYVFTRRGPGLGRLKHYWEEFLSLGGLYKDSMRLDARVAIEKSIKSLVQRNSEKMWKEGAWTDRVKFCTMHAVPQQTNDDGGIVRFAEWAKEQAAKRGRHRSSSLLVRSTAWNT